MRKRRTPAQRGVGPAAKLVAKAKKALAVTTDDDLARALSQRYGIKVTQSAVWGWANDPLRSQGPKYQASLALLHAAGWLTDEARATLAREVAAAGFRLAQGAEEAPKPARRGKAA